MKTKVATILAVVMLVAGGVLSRFETNAKNTSEVAPAPALTSNGVIMPEPLPQSDFGSNHGKITRIYAEATGIYFRLGGRPTEFQNAMNPTNGYYFIPMSHPNYHALRDLLQVAAVNRLNLKARTEPKLGLAGRADVMYLVQDF